MCIFSHFFGYSTISKNAFRGGAANQLSVDSYQSTVVIPLLLSLFFYYQRQLKQRTARANIALAGSDFYSLFFYCRSRVLMRAYMLSVLSL